MMLSRAQAKLVRDIVAQYSGGFRTRVVEPLKGVISVLQGWIPDEITEYKSELSVLTDPEKWSFTERSMVVRPQQLPVLKRALITQRLAIARESSSIAKKTFHIDSRARIEARTKEMDELLQLPELKRTVPAREPGLIDFLTPALALGHRGLPTPDSSELDEKFGILAPSNRFAADLDTWRNLCEVRNVPLTVAYIDIDNFKDFNTTYSETQVDRSLLPVFMRALEALVFARGKAYRFGGDEYVVLLPNHDFASAALLLLDFQRRLRSLKYPGIEDHVTVSVGMYCIDSNSPLTDEEVLASANLAKNEAKNRGRDRIAYATNDLGTEFAGVAKEETS